MFFKGKYNQIPDYITFLPPKHIPELFNFVSNDGW